MAKPKDYYSVLLGRGYSKEAINRLLYSLIRADIAQRKKNKTPKPR